MKVQTISGTCKNQAMPFNLPIFLTWLRVALVPLLVGIFYLPEHWISLYAQSLTAAIIFIAFLDPVADKLIVAGSLLVLVQLGRVSAILGFIIIGREIAISALREWMAKIGESKSVAVSSLGKVKTIAQMIAIPMLLFYNKLFYFIDTAFIGTYLLVIAAILTVVSMLYYLRKALPLMK